MARPFFVQSFSDNTHDQLWPSGESEYWFATIKVLMIIVFIFVGLIYDWGGVKHHPGPVSRPSPLYVRSLKILSYTGTFELP